LAPPVISATFPSKSIAFLRSLGHFPAKEHRQVGREQAWSEAGWSGLRHLGRRHQRRYGCIGAGFKYPINRHLFPGLNYNFQHRNLAFAGGSYQQHIVLGRIGAPFERAGGREIPALS
jgi:hypothetical protein